MSFSERLQKKWLLTFALFSMALMYFFIFTEASIKEQKEQSEKLSKLQKQIDDLNNRLKPSSNTKEGQQVKKLKKLKEEFRILEKLKKVNGRAEEMHWLNDFSNLANKYDIFLQKASTATAEKKKDKQSHQEDQTNLTAKQLESRALAMARRQAKKGNRENNENQKENPLEKYFEWSPHDVEIIGSYNNVILFLNALSKTKKIHRISNIKIEHQGDIDFMLVFKLKVHL